MCLLDTTGLRVKHLLAIDGVVKKINCISSEFGDEGFVDILTKKWKNMLKNIEKK